MHEKRGNNRSVYRGAKNRSCMVHRRLRVAHFHVCLGTRCTPPHVDDGPIGFGGDGFVLVYTIN